LARAWPRSALGDGPPPTTLRFTPFTFKDYLYPNEPASGDPNDSPSSLWYHDHSMDTTGPNVYAGLAGLYPTTDAHEDRSRRQTCSPGDGVRRAARSAGPAVQPRRLALLRPDADRSQHGALVAMGNDRTGRWQVASTAAGPEQIAQLALRTAGLRPTLYLPSRANFSVRPVTM
jgi:hypothetical protein